MGTRSRILLPSEILWKEAKNRNNWNSTFLEEYRTTFENLGKWPLGVKEHLAKKTELELDDTQRVVYQEDIGNCTRWVVSTEHNGPQNKYWCHVHRWYYPHPRLKFGYTWLRGPGFSIPGYHAAYWLAGILRLQDLDETSGNSHLGLFVYELKYGFPVDGYEYHNIRFFPQSKSGNLFCQIQDFRYRGGEYFPSRRCVYWPLGSTGLPNALKEALENVHQWQTGQLLPSREAVSIEVPDIAD